jgi:hypothetical protein
MAFNKRVSMTKRNHIYFGSTESKKIAIELEESYVDLNNVYDQFNVQQSEFDALASGYLDPSGRLKQLSSDISEIEESFDWMTYIHATQDPII